MKKSFRIVLAATILLCTTTNLGAVVEITPRISVGTDYTDNVRLVPDDAAIGPESDYITTITPGISLNVYGRTAGLELSYDPGYVTYHDDSYEDYWRHAVNADGWWQSGRNTRWTLTNAFLKTEDPISDDDLTVRRSRNPYIRNTANIGLDQQFGAENTFRAAFRHSILDNDDPTIDDSQEYVPSLGLTYWLNVRWGLDFSGSYTRAEYDVPDPELADDFDNLSGTLRLLHRFNRQVTGFIGYTHTDLAYDNSDESLFFLNDYVIHDAFAGFDYDINETTFLSLSVGYFKRDVENGPDDDGTPLNLDFTKTFQRGSVTLNAESGYNYTTVSTENLGYYQFYGGGLTADYQFARQITGDVNALYEQREYKDDPLQREDDVFRAGCGLTFQMFQWLSMRAGYSYRTVDSTVETNDYKENRVSLLFTLEPPQPYRVGQ